MDATRFNVKFSEKTPYVCPHCNVTFSRKWDAIGIQGDRIVNGWCPTNLVGTSCTSCEKPIIYMATTGSQLNYNRVVSLVRIAPRHAQRDVGRFKTDVTPNIFDDYVEAVDILAYSPKASATMTRRVLQMILNDQGFKDDNLHNQIGMLLKSKTLPPYLSDVVDLMRNFGNFGAYPVTDVSTLQIIDVDEGEAETCIELLEALMDHYFVQPAKHQTMVKKIRSAGKSVQT